jgi:hypothetical protein
VLVLVAGAFAFLIGRAWVVPIPVVLGIIVGGLVLAVGGTLDDTPLPIVTALATIAAGSAIALRRRVMAI